MEIIMHSWIRIERIRVIECILYFLFLYFTVFPSFFLSLNVELNIERIYVSVLRSGRTRTKVEDRSACLYSWLSTEIHGRIERFKK